MAGTTITVRRDSVSPTDCRTKRSCAAAMASSTRSPPEAQSGTGGYGFQGFDSVPDWMTSLPLRWRHSVGTPERSVPGHHGRHSTCEGIGAGRLVLRRPGIRGPLINGQNVTPTNRPGPSGFQHELGAGIIVEANYVGKKGTKLYFGGAQEHEPPGTASREIQPRPDRRLCRRTCPTRSTESSIRTPA